MAGFNKNIRDISEEIHVWVPEFRVVHEYFVGLAELEGKEN